MTIKDLKAGDKFIFAVATTDRSDLYVRTEDNPYKFREIEDYPLAVGLRDGIPIFPDKSMLDSEVILIKT